MEKTMVKLGIWTITLIGLTPSVIVALAALFVLTALHKQPGISRYQQGAIIHDAYFMLGSVRLDFTPQYWSIAMLLLGVAMILVGLAAILRS